MDNTKHADPELTSVRVRVLSALQLCLCLLKEGRQGSGVGHVAKLSALGVRRHQTRMMPGGRFLRRGGEEDGVKAVVKGSICRGGHSSNME